MKQIHSADNRLLGSVEYDGERDVWVARSLYWLHPYTAHSESAAEEWVRWVDSRRDIEPGR